MKRLLRYFFMLTVLSFVTETAMAQVQEIQGIT